MGDVAVPLLETKLRQPLRREGTVARPRLLRRLTAADGAPLTLVSAAAGFGKTTLIADWLDGRPSIAWVSLDARDNDPLLFWSYVAAALAKVDADIGQHARALLAAPQASIDHVVATLVNDLERSPHHVTLVLDDFHVVEHVSTQQALAMLVEHVPANVRIVLSTRADPALPLANLRARGQLCEIRASDLRFTRDEAATYLGESMGLALSSEDVQRLDDRAEGWIAALQLAALSMQGRDDLSSFVTAFAGDDRFVLDYLVGEVLDRQTQHTREFLLRTSVLNRFNGALCDAVTGRRGGRATLEQLDRANVFLVPLDDRRDLYRYHHLFGDVLRTRLLDEAPDDVDELHRRASDWLEANGDRPEAIHHALVARWFDRAAELIERAGPAMRLARREVTLREWYEALPSETMTTRPVLAIGYIGAIMASPSMQGFERVAELLDVVDRCLDPNTAPDDIVVFDHDSFANLAAHTSVYRAALALVAQDPAGAVEHATRAIELGGPSDHLLLGSATAIVGLAQWATGDLAAAEDRYVDAIQHLEDAGHRADALGCTLALADIRAAQGRLRDAIHLLERALAHIEPARPLRGVADLHVALAELHLERDDLVAAARHLESGRELGEHFALGQHPYRSRIARARLLHATDAGDHAAIDVLIDEAVRRYDTDFSPPVRPPAASGARLRLLRGDAESARRWASEVHLSADDELSYVREFEHLTFARLLVAEGTLDQAEALSRRLREAAAHAGRVGAEVEASTLLALVHLARGDRAAALVDVEHASALAAPERHRRVFVDAGPTIEQLLAGTASDEHDRVGTTPASPGASKGRLVVELSERELEVLRLLRSDLSGPAIAAELIVSLNTLRTHTKSIFTKLGVNSRREAVTKAAELGL